MKNNIANFLKGGFTAGRVKLNVQDATKAKLLSLEDSKGAPAGTAPSPPPPPQEKPTEDFKENSPPASVIKRTRAGRGAATATKANGPSKSRIAAAAAAAEAPVDDGDLDGERPRQQAKQRGSRAVNEPPGEVPAPSRPLEAPPAQPAGGRASRPSSKRNSSGAVGVPRTGEEIWQLNLQLGKIAESLADPEDAKPGRRRYKSPTLQEKLHKSWGGTYGQKIEKELAALDVEEPPAPKYEAPTFLDELITNDEGDDELLSAANGPVSALDAARRETLVPPAPAVSPAAAPVWDLTAEGPADAPTAAAAATATGAPSKKGAAAGAAAGGGSGDGGGGGGAAKATGRRGAAAASAAAVALAGAEAPAAQAATRPPAGAEKEAAEDLLGGAAETHDEKNAGGGGGVQGGGFTSMAAEPQPTEEARAAPVARRGARKAAGADAGTGAGGGAAKAATTRAPSRRAGRGAAAAAAATAADPELEEPPGPSDPVEPPQSSALAPATCGRARKSHLPQGVTFGPSSSKPPPAPPLSFAGVPEEGAGPSGSGGGGDVNMAGAGAGPGCLTASAVAKRARDSSAPVGDDKARQNKALRLEQQQQQQQQQQLKENEGLRQRNAELEQRLKEKEDCIKQLQAELKAGERKATQAEKDRAQRASDLSTAQREIEKLKTSLEERDEKIAALKEELKTAKAFHAKWKQAEGMLQEWAAEGAQMQSRRQQQLEQYLKASRG